MSFVENSGLVEMVNQLVMDGRTVSCLLTMLVLVSGPWRSDIGRVDQVTGVNLKHIKDHPQSPLE